MTKQERVIEDLINKMFELSGHDVKYTDINEREDAWYTDWTMTTDQYTDWIEWGTEYIRKNLRLRKETAKKQMAWFALNYGLKFSDL